MSRPLHQSVLVLLLLLNGATAARAADGDVVAGADGARTNRSLSLPVEADSADAPVAQTEKRSAPNAGPVSTSGSADGKSSQSAGANGGERTPSEAQPSPNSSAQPSSSASPYSAAAESGAASPEPGTATVPGAQGTSDPSSLPARERRPLGPPSASKGDREKLAEGSSDRSWMLQTLAALGVVITLILLLRMGLQRLGGGPAGPAAGGLVEVLARTSIGPRTQVLFLRINQRVVVVAQSSSGLQTLTELSDPEDVAWVLGRVESAQPMSISRGFRTLMQRAERDYNRAATAGVEDGGDEEEQYVDRTRSQLSGLLNHIRTLKQRAP